MSILDAFEPQRGQGATPQPDLAQLRVVPFQPEGTPQGYVYMGAELGHVFFAGERPRPGDLVAVVGQPGSYVAIPRRTARERDPLFAGKCRCKCPAGTGTIFFVANEIGASRLSHVIGLGVPDFPARLFLGQEDTVKIVGLAVDTQGPNTLYVIDDRRSLFNKVTDASPSQVILADSYYTVIQYNLTGSSYAVAATYALTNPGLPGSIFFTLDPVEDLIRNQIDPPSVYPANPMSVVDGQLYITMNRAPARYQRLEGGTLVTHTLTEGDVPYNRGLRGRIVSVRDRPADRRRRYVISWAGSDTFADALPGAVFEVLEFNDEDEITAHVTDSLLTSPFQLASICNRLIVLQSDRYGRTANDPNGTPLPRV